MTINYNIPAGICNDAKNLLKEIIKELENRNVLSVLDTAALDMLGRNYSQFIAASRRLETEDLILVTSTGNPIPNPLIKIAKDSQIQAIKIMEQMGLTIKARQRIENLRNKDDDSMPLDEYIQ